MHEAGFLHFPIVNRESAEQIAIELMHRQLRHPGPGEIVQAGSDKDALFTIVSAAGKILSEEEASSPETLYPIIAQGVQGMTWVLQSFKPKRYNKRLNDAKWEQPGDGKLEQRRAMAVVSPRGFFRLVLFSKEQEIAALGLCGKPLEEWYVTPNRRSDTDNGTEVPAEICWISDHLFYSEEGCAVREAYIRDEIQAKEREAGRRLCQQYPMHVMSTEADRVYVDLPVVPGVPLGTPPAEWVAEPSPSVVPRIIHQTIFDMLQANREVNRRVLEDVFGAAYVKSFSEWYAENQGELARLVEKKRKRDLNNNKKTKKKET